MGEVSNSVPIARYTRGQHHIRCVAFSPPPSYGRLPRVAEMFSALDSWGEDVVPSLSLTERGEFTKELRRARRVAGGWQTGAARRAWTR